MEENENRGQPPNCLDNMFHLPTRHFVAQKSLVFKMTTWGQYKTHIRKYISGPFCPEISNYLRMCDQKNVTHIRGH